MTSQKPFSLLLPISSLAAALAVAGCLAPDAVPAAPQGGGGGQGGGDGGSGGEGGAGTSSFEVAWAKSYGIDADADQRARSVSATAARDLLVAGEFRGSFTMGSLPALPNTEGLDAFVAQIDAAGEPAWVMGFAGLGEQRVHRVVATPDGGFVVAGAFTQSLTFAGAEQGATPSGEDGFVASLDADQTLRWLVRLSGPGAQSAHALALADDGGVFVAGPFEASVQVGDLTVEGDTETPDFFVAKLDAAGEPLWATSLAGDPAPLPPGQPSCHLAASPAGGVHVAGTFTGTLVLDENLGAVGLRDVFVARLDAAGAPTWAHTLGATNSRQRASALSVDAAGRVLLAGDLQGAVSLTGVPLAADGDEPDAFLALFDPDGDVLWARRYGSVAEDHGDAAAFTPGGDILFAGRFRGSIHFGAHDPLLASGAVSDDDDLFVAKLTPDGEPLVTRAFGAEGDQIPTALTIDADGDLLVAGYFEGAVDFGAGPLDALAGDDLFAVKILH